MSLYKRERMTSYTVKTILYPSVWLTAGLIRKNRGKETDETDETENALFFRFRALRILTFPYEQVLSAKPWRLFSDVYTPYFYNFPDHVELPCLISSHYFFGSISLVRQN